MGFFREFLGIQRDKVAAGFRRSPGPRIDEGAPLGARIGGYVHFERTPFIIAKAAGLHLDHPSSREIAAYGKIRYEGFVIHRFHLQDGDREVDHILQVITAPNGKIDGVPRLYRLHKEIEPSGAEEWSFWLPDPKKPEQPYYIGTQVFGLLDKDDKTPLADFRRMWPNANTDALQVEPREFTEQLHTSPYDAHIKVRHQAMLYGRQVPRPANFPSGAEPPDEWVMLTAQDFPGAAMMQIHVGVDLELRHLTVTPPAVAAA
jgi:hypothetical protein